MWSTRAAVVRWARAVPGTNGYPFLAALKPIFSLLALLSQQPMEISAERAFLIFEQYRRTRRELEFGGQFLGTQSTCTAVIRNVWPEARAIAVRLSDAQLSRTWDCFMPMAGAAFSLIRCGDTDFDSFAIEGQQAILTVRLADGS